MRSNPFYKYHGTGNDFILLDNRAGEIVLEKAHIAALCHRRFGIGADGLMLVETAPGADFRMVYYNADGGESTMCGNGGRCIVAFANSLGIIGNKARFVAIDGSHEALLYEDGIVRLKMLDVAGIDRYEDHVLLNTGSPHFVQWVEDTAIADVVRAGREIRYSPTFPPEGINVNFVQRISEQILRVRTYERGVEDETMSCGTGVVASAIAASGDGTGAFSFQIETPGGALAVSFDKTSPDTAKNVWLSGPAKFVFAGEILI